MAFVGKIKSRLAKFCLPEQLISKKTLEGINYKPNTARKRSKDYILKISFVNKGFTRIIKNSQNNQNRCTDRSGAG